MYDKVKKILKNSDENLEFFFDAFVQKCLIYMNREDIPKKLESIIIEAFIVDYQKIKQVKSIKEGDTSVEYELYTEKLPLSLTTQLNRFRKVGVIRRERVRDIIH